MVRQVQGDFKAEKNAFLCLFSVLFRLSKVQIKNRSFVFSKKLSFSFVCPSMMVGRIHHALYTHTHIYINIYTHTTRTTHAQKKKKTDFGQGGV
jgi:hypothetical protein